MKTIDIKRTLLFHGKTYLPGTDVEVPDDFPDLDERGLPIFPEGSAAAQNQALSRSFEKVAPLPLTADDIASMSKRELMQLAEARGITVTRSDGKEGDPNKQDYLDALMP